MNTKRWSERTCDALAELKIERKINRKDGKLTSVEDRREERLLDKAIKYAEGTALVEAQNQLAQRQGPDARMNTTIRARYNEWSKKPVKAQADVAKVA